MSVVAIVVARGGSVRLPGKALLPFGESTLIGHKIDTLKKCALVDRVVVNTDSAAIRDEAVRHGAVAIAGRDYAGDTREMIRDSAEKAGGSIILWAHPTNPLVGAERYDQALRAFYSYGLHDSLCSVFTIQRHAWFQGTPSNFSPTAERHKLASELAPIQFQDGAIFIQTRKAMLDNKYFYGSRPLLFEIPAYEGIDIDTREDYEAALRLSQP